MKETNDSSNSTSATPPAKRRKLDDGYDLWRCSSDEEEETDELEEYLRCKTGSCSAENILNWWKERVKPMTYIGYSYSLFVNEFLRQKN